MYTMVSQCEWYQGGNSGVSFFTEGYTDYQTPPWPVAESRILFYQSEDGTGRIEVRPEERPVWLSQALIAELYQTTKQNVGLHIRNIFAEGELQSDSVVKEYLTTPSWKTVLDEVL